LSAPIIVVHYGETFAVKAITSATPDQAEYLGVKVGQPILVVN
jgi:hypothetical protein